VSLTASAAIVKGLPVLCVSAVFVAAWSLDALRAPTAAIFVDRPPTWFEDFAKVGSVSDDGRWLAYGTPGARRLIDLRTGRDAPERRDHDLAGVDDIVFLTDGRLARRGLRGGQRGWFVDGTATGAAGIPDDATPAWAADGRVAFVRGAERTILRVGTAANVAGHDLSKRIVGFAWTRDSREILALLREDDGGATLVAVDAAAGTPRVIRSGLDTSAWFPGPAPSPDGRSAVVALASVQSPNAEARHRPDSDRDLDLYTIDLKTGELQLVEDSPADDFAPVVSGGSLYWTRNHVEHSIVLVPFGGGPARDTRQRGELPSWHPNGRQLAYMVGDWRMVDIPMNLDAVVIDVDDDGAARGAPRPIVTGYHEDFPPVWSPDGRWIAYHSHRSTAAIPFHDAPGASDDIYLRRADDANAEEIRLTDFGWEVGSPSWSHDSRRLLLRSWERGAPGVAVPWVVSIDPETGRREQVERWRVPESIARVRNLVWSPVAPEVAVEAEAPGAGARELWVARQDGTSAERLATYRSTTHGGVGWSRDGQTIGYAGLAGERLQLFAVARRGGEPRQLTRDDGNLLHPAVSPDGRWIAATRFRVTKSIMRVAAACGVGDRQPCS
jgi:Tol biopolymer transport system component